MTRAKLRRGTVGREGRVGGGSGLNDVCQPHRVFTEGFRADELEWRPPLGDEWLATEFSVCDATHFGFARYAAAKSRSTAFQSG